MIKFYKLKKTIRFLTLISLLLLGFSNARAALSKGDLAVIDMNSNVDTSGSTVRSFAVVVLNDNAAFLFSRDRVCVSDS